MEGRAPLQLFVRLLARCLPLRALRRRARQSQPRSRRSARAGSGRVAHVQGKGPAHACRARGALCDSLRLERRPRVGNLLVAVPAGALPLLTLPRPAPEVASIAPEGVTPLYAPMVP